MERVTIPRDGGSVGGELALPSNAKAPALVVVHEWWGINPDVRRMCERFAAEGFVALAIDLFGGKSTTEVPVAMQLANDLQTGEAVKEMSAAVSFLKAHPATNGKVGVTGFCLGGAMTLAAAFNVEGVSAAAAFYGIPRADFVHFDRKVPPIQGHYGAKDAFIESSKPQGIADGVNKNGGSFELFMYEAGHAFMREGDPAAYDEPSSKLAWERACKFLHAHLG